jgi:cytochrome c peroxidase
MWNSRFTSLSDDPFDNSQGFSFPPPEGMTLSFLPHLLVAQAFIPPTERIEMAGFDHPGGNADIREEVIRRLNLSAPYVQQFRARFPTDTDAPITYEMLALALAEFQISLTLADAPIDRFARGDELAMTKKEKQGALLFFGKAKCVSCHAVSGRSNEMFSDFSTHVISVPQIVPSNTNASFDGAGQNEDFGLEQITGNAADRYKFRSSPLRNIAVQKSFFHNGAFTKLEDAIEHHLDVVKSVKKYQPSHHVAADLSGPLAPMEPVLAKLDSQIRKPIKLNGNEFEQLVAFVRFGLLDERTLLLNDLIPKQLVSGFEPLEFEP